MHRREYDDASGQYYNRGRYLDPATGRFLSQDPTGFGGGDDNLYRYAGNDPAGSTDPDGARRKRKAKHGIGVFGGASAGDDKAQTWYVRSFGTWGSPRVDRSWIDRATSPANVATVARQTMNSASSALSATSGWDGAIFDPAEVPTQRELISNPQGPLKSPGSTSSSQ